MGDPSLRELEHDVEVARSKLARDLSTLRSPDTFSEFTSAVKQEALTAKDAIIDKAKTSIQSAVESFVEELKAKAAANPTAALAIGAGIAWRIIQRPPIASALIGAGLISLMKTNASANGRSNSDYVAEATERLREQAVGFAADVKEQAGRAVEVAKDQIGEVAGVATERAGDALRAATERVAAGASAAKEQIEDWTNKATSTIRDKVDHASERAAMVGERVTDQIRGLRDSVGQAADKMAVVPRRLEALSSSLGNTVSARETRDSLLLGAASVAVIAALGIACQKRLTETTPTD